MTWSLLGGSGNTIGEEVGSQIYILFCFISCTIISHITVNTYSFIVDCDDNDDDDADNDDDDADSLLCDRRGRDWKNYWWGGEF